MALLVTAATEKELSAALPELNRQPLPEQKIFSVPGSSLLACITGVGPINAALAMGRCLADTRVTAVLNTGLAGSFELEQFPLRSVVLVTEELFPEYGMNNGVHVDGPALGFPQWTRGDTPIYNRLSLDSPRLCGLNPPAGMPSAASLTVSGVSCTPARAKNLHRLYRAGLENMEGFAVALACARQNIPCTEIRCVSNKAGAQIPEHRDFAGAFRTMTDCLPELLKEFCHAETQSLSRAGTPVD